MQLISSFLYYFTPYINTQERAVGRFFKALTEKNDPSGTRTQLDILLQQNIAVINLWTEYRYKGYKYLRKAERKRLYANLQLIAEDFDRFSAMNLRPVGALPPELLRLAPHAVLDPQKIAYLQTIMDYFSPARGIYQYRDRSSFGRLLRNPSQEKLVGDCNQIVTLYIYLYSRHYDVHDLQIRMLPGHVALHYGGVDIEATNSTFGNYSDSENSRLLPIEEMVSVNLLDMTDTYLSTHEVAAEDMLSLIHI